MAKELNNRHTAEKATQQYGGWQTKLQALINRHNTMKTNQKGQTSHRTRAKRAEMMFHIFRELRGDLGYKLEDPANLKKKHIDALVKMWIDNQLSPETIDNKISILRTLCGWMNKQGIVLRLEDYAPDLRRAYAAQHDKSWSGNQVSFWEIWDKVFVKSQPVAMQLLLVAAFGARKAEAVNFKPHIHAANDIYIELVDGTKGGRPRVMPVDTDFKRMVIKTLKQFVDAKGKWGKGHLGNPDRSLEQNLVHYGYVMRAVGITKKSMGVTGHGLRAEFVIDELKKRGLDAPIIGGSGKLESQAKTEIAYLNVSEQLGHSRKSVMTAYCGSFRADLLKAHRTEEVKQRLDWKEDAAKHLEQRTWTTQKFTN